MNNKLIDLTQFDEAIEEARKNKQWKKLLHIACKIHDIADEIIKYSAEINQEGVDIWDEVTPDNQKRHYKPNHE